MRSYTASTLLALLLLLLATLPALPAGQQTIVLQPLTLTATFYVEPGDVVAPHIYDWYFDGVNDYVKVPSYGDPTVFTVEAWFYTDRITHQAVASKNQYAWRFGFPYVAGNFGFRGVNSDGTSWVIELSPTPYIGKWVHAVGVADVGVAKLYANASLVRSTSWKNSFYITGRPLYIGVTEAGTSPPFSLVAYFKGFISLIRIYSRALSASEIAQAYNGVVGSSDLVLFLDATFYNGTHYVDLAGGDNNGVGYGGVSRVLSDRPHLYLVKGLHGDGLVHFRFFPVNTVVDVYDATTNSSVTSFVIDGPANPAGMVEDYAVSLGPRTYRLTIYTSVYVQVAQPSLPAMKLVAAHFKAVFGPGCRVYIDYTAWPKAEPRAECGLQTDVAFLTGLPAGATVRVWNGTVAYELTASSTGVAVLGGLRHGEYEVKVYSDTLQIPHDHLLRLDPLSGLRQFFGFWDRLTFSLFTPVFVVGLVLAVYLRTWSAILTALAALAAHIVLAPDNIWIRGLLALALAAAIYIAVWRRTTLI